MMNDDQVTIFADRSAMKKHFDMALQFDKERQSVILQSIGDAVIATDMDGNIILMNPIAENLTGWKSEEAEYKPITEVLHIIDSFTRRKKDNPVNSVLKNGKALKLGPNTILISRNGKKEYSINDSCAPILNVKGNIIGVVLVFRDVTKLKQEETLKEKITADLVKQNEDHEHFAYIISHDLRGPVSNILGLTTLVNSKDLKESERDFIMNSLTNSARRLDEIIVDLNHILNIGKQLNEKKEHVYFSKLVGDIQESIGNILEREQVIFKFDFSRADQFLTIKSYMHSIFYNLISNSIKYRRPLVPLEITIKSDQVAEKCILSFKDNGLGIDLRKSGHNMFQLYKRFHIDKAEGKGVGLYMVKMQVEKLNGKISVKSKVNQGTEFTIVFSP